MEYSMENQFQLTSSKDIINYLSQQFPNCFSLEGEAKPLKIGIFQDIITHLESSELLSKTKLRVALRTYTMSWRYLYSIKEGANRVDLDGNATEVITKEQMEHAQQLLKESKQQAKERAKLKRKAAPKPNRKPRALKIGDSVKVNVGKKPIKGQIITIEKDQIKVKVGTGMELTVKPEHIINR